MERKQRLPIAQMEFFRVYPEIADKDGEQVKEEALECESSDPFLEVEGGVLNTSISQYHKTCF